MWLTGTPGQEGCGEVPWTAEQLVDVASLIGGVSPYVAGRGNLTDALSVPITLSFPSATGALEYCATLPWSLPADGELRFEDGALIVVFPKGAFTNLKRKRCGRSVELVYEFTVTGPPTVETLSDLNPLAATDTRPAWLLNMTTLQSAGIITATGTLASGVNSASRSSAHYALYFVFQLSPGQAGNYTFETDGALDSYMYLHSTANSTAYSEVNLLAEDDDSGPSAGSKIVLKYDGLAPLTAAIEVTTYDAATPGDVTLTVTKSAYIPPAVVSGNELSWTLSATEFEPFSVAEILPAYTIPDGKKLTALEFQFTKTGDANLTDLVLAFGYATAPSAANITESWAAGLALLGNVDAIVTPSFMIKAAWTLASATIAPNTFYSIDLTSLNITPYIQTLWAFNGNASASGAWSGLIKLKWEA